jgi:LuxR family transcriptional regulator, maltose regulon positive regulatory protein
VPDVLTPDLLETLSGEPSAPAALELARSNVFLEAEPGPGSCLRYVPFFRDLLRAQFAYESPDRLIQVHRAAAAWYAAHGMWGDVATHLAGAGDWDGVADLLVEHLLLGRLLVEGVEGPLLAVARALPTTPGSPARHLTAAAIALQDQDPDRAAVHAQEARSSVRWPTQPEAAGVVAAALEAVVAVGRADAPTARDLAARAGELVEGFRRSRGLSAGADLAAVVALAHARAALRLGDAEEARAMLATALACETAAQSPAYRTDCLVHLAVIQLRKGAVGRAARLSEEALGLGDDGHRLTGGLSPRRCTAHLAAAYVALERHDLDRVHDHLALVGPHPDPFWQGVLDVVTAAAKSARGSGRPGSGGTSASRMVESLTPRELEVLACMSQWLTTDEIAENLFVSVNTVRTHVRNILTKMGVSRRNAAIREGFRLGLLES